MRMSRLKNGCMDSKRGCCIVAIFLIIESQMSNSAECEEIRSKNNLFYHFK